MDKEGWHVIKFFISEVFPLFEPIGGSLLKVGLSHSFFHFHFLLHEGSYHIVCRQFRILKRISQLHMSSVLLTIIGVLITDATGSVVKNKPINVKGVVSNLRITTLCI